jgi:hypothetical protein
MLFKSIVTLFAVSGLVAAAPTKNATVSASSSNGGVPTVIVQNNCPAALTVGNSVASSWTGDVISVAAGSSHTYTFSVGWTGRIWGRSNCSGSNCNQSGMGSPASLAEFNFQSNGDVFYDISLVDGFNLPMVVAPAEKISLPNGDSRLCATPSCSSLPSCPSGFETYDDQGKVSGCMSACTKFKTDEYCCTGAYNSPNTCKSNDYASAVKATCPDVYTYAYDDYTSAFMCTSTTYTVTFC